MKVGEWRKLTGSENIEGHKILGHECQGCSTLKKRVEATWLYRSPAGIRLYCDKCHIDFTKFED
jgi:hypothetical protein